MFVLVKRSYPRNTSAQIWWPARKIDDAKELREAAQHENCEVKFSDIVNAGGENVIVQYIDGRPEANFVVMKMDKKTMIQPYYLGVSELPTKSRCAIIMDPKK